MNKGWTLRTIQVNVDRSMKVSAGLRERMVRRRSI